MHPVARWQWRELASEWRPLSLFAGAAALVAAIWPPAMSLRVLLLLAIAWALGSSARYISGVLESGTLSRLSLSPRGPRPVLLATLLVRAGALAALLLPAVAVLWALARSGAAGPAVPAALAALRTGEDALALWGAVLTGTAAGAVVALTLRRQAHRRTAAAAATALLWLLLAPPGPPPLAFPGAPAGPQTAVSALVAHAPTLYSRHGTWAVATALGGTLSVGLAAALAPRLLADRR
ncbi:hypothetical protein [Caldinitratiruptor microaerophilus]|uniref:Uncharacterized protein n=1 Tax=Caldinitratiruptor microaerophilus TaxID=671077 RepID=A0AA35CNB3_9FIRM|nr:hypothetical protein [Caldinitratiruptor microaerophilus]BDG60732.1 hypothetical protein caldi_18220 [Caldinitratiruptor microaerophilus]